MMTAPRLAAYLGRSDTWLREHMADLRKKGFPGKVDPFDAWDKRAVDAWLDRQSGLLPAPATSPDGQGWEL